MTVKRSSLRTALPSMPSMATLIQSGILTGLATLPPTHTISIFTWAVHTSLMAFAIYPVRTAVTTVASTSTNSMSAPMASTGALPLPVVTLLTATEQEALFAAPVTGAFMRLVALSSYDGDIWTSVAEITVLGTLTSGNQAPDSIINTPGSDLTINVGDTLNFTGTGSDPDGNLPLTYHWSFGAGSGIADANIKDPGSKKFNYAGVFTVSFTVTDSFGLPDPTPAVRIITVQTASPQTIPKTGWSLLSVDSEEIVAENGAAVNAFDGDINTIWHTDWSSNPTAHPHNIDIYLGGSYQLNGFRYLPRQDGGDNGRINKYEFYVSTDGVNWGTPAASGHFADNATEQEALFAAPVTGAFVRLVALSSYDGDIWTSVAEITVLGTLTSGNQAPDSIINTGKLLIKNKTLNDHVLSVHRLFYRD